MEKKSPFLLNWNYQANQDLIDQIVRHFYSDQCPTLGELSFLEYSMGIRKEENISENGIYIFKFESSFYVGKATSCTILERIAKHFDSRKVGGFNGLLKKLAPFNESTDSLALNQDILRSSKLLLLPINKIKLESINPNCNTGNSIEHLEMDLIIKLRDAFKEKELNSKIKSQLSGSFFL